jgi:hypothetical protein
MSLKVCTKKTLAVAASVVTTSFGPALALGVAVSQQGCFVFGSPGPSMVGQGTKYQSGDPNFDQFFTSLYDLQIEMSKAPAQEKEIRQDIAKLTKSDPDASATLLGKKVEKKAKELAEAGTGLALEVEGLEGEGAPSVKIVVEGKELSGDDKSYVDDVEKAAKAEAKLLGRMRDITRELEQMRATSVALDQQVDASFRKGGPSKKAEVRKNLEDARTLMPLMAARAQETSDAAKAALKKLSEAMNTKGAYKKEEAPPPPPPEEETTPEEPGKPKPPAGSGTKPPAGSGTKPPTGSGTKPPPPPPPPDFEP